MSRYFPLCILLIFLALLGSIVAPRAKDPPKYGKEGPPVIEWPPITPIGGESKSGRGGSREGSSHGGGSRGGDTGEDDSGSSGAEDAPSGGGDSTKGLSYGERMKLSMRMKSKWKGVTVKKGGGVTGILRARYHLPLTLYYDFYANDTLKDGHTTGVKPTYSWKVSSIRHQTISGTSVTIYVKEEKFTLVFKNDDDARMFHGWEWED